ncbi:MAG: hypothetical protein ACK4WJ_02040 [Endomicrobiia bacterium]
MLFTFPLILINTKIAKPHTLGMFFVLLGTYFAYKNFDKEEFKNYILSGVFFGCAFSVLYTNFISIFLLYFVDFVKQKFNLKSLFNKKIISATMIFFTVFLLTNWYIIPDFEKFLRRKKELAIIFHYGDFNFLESFNFLKEFFSTNLSLFLLPIIIYSFYLIFKNKEKKFYPLVIFITIHFVFLVFYLKHPNVFIISLPYLSIICVYGILHFLKNNVVLGEIYSVVVVLFLILNTVFQTKFFVKYGNLTKAGDWINKNIPKDSSININDGWFSMGDYPAFNFLSYRLIHLPLKEKWEYEKLPQYLISVENFLEKYNQEELNKYYKEIYILSPPKFLFFNKMKYTPNENSEVKIYKKI